MTRKTVVISMLLLLLSLPNLQLILITLTGSIYRREQIIYTILGVPFEDLEFLTRQNAIRTNGSSTAREASSANQ